MGSGKDIIDTLAIDGLRGLPRCNPKVSLDTTHKITYIKPSSQRVHIFSGGGSGHEPASAGFVGSNMLDCAVSGDIFASPSASAVTAEIINLRDNPVLMIVLNYMGDRLHFGIAAENANSMGHEVDFVVVDDDVSVGRKQGGRVGRRGLAAVKTLAKEVVANLVTASVSLTHASVPGSSSDPSQELKVDEIEVGTGIHNEPGFQKQKIQNASEIVKGLLKQLLDQVDNNRAYVPFKDQDEVVLMINNLGGISTLEMYHLTEVISRQVEDVDGLKILRTYTGSFVTSLDGAGASITLLNLTNLKDSKTVLQYLDLPTDAPGWNSAVQSSNWSFKNPETVTSPVARERAKEIIPIDSKLAESAINGACNSLITAEPEITQYDTVAGDGDAGTTLKSASQAALKHGKISSTNLVDLFGDIAAVLEGSMGGTGGALYTIYFAALSSALPASSSSETTTTTSADVRMMAEAVQMALDRLATYITATIGDKPLMDALIPFSESLSSTRSFPKAVEAAKAGASSTRGMAALLGRATYVESSATLTVPDAVAAGVWKLVQGILDSSDHSKSW